MIAILIESVLFLAPVAAGVALLFWAISASPIGKRWKQNANRRRIDRQADLTCAVHGLQVEADMVRLPTGERMCPQCYREAVHGVID